MEEVLRERTTRMHFSCLSFFSLSFVTPAASICGTTKSFRKLNDTVALVGEGAIVVVVEEEDFGATAAGPTGTTADAGADIFFPSSL